MKEQILLGTLLGDGGVYRYGRNKTYSIRWQHSLKQEEYAIWKAENSLDNYSVYRGSKFDKRTNKVYTFITCYSIVDDYSYYRSLFYKDKKEVNQNVLNKLQPLGLAVWYLDDGNMYYNGNNCHITLSVNGFNENSKDLIISYFKKYDLNFKKSQKAIRITSKKECEIFMNLVEKYIPNCMEYKKLSYQVNKYKINKNAKKISAL